MRSRRRSRGSWAKIRYGSTQFLARAADRGWHHYPYLGNGATARSRWRCGISAARPTAARCTSSSAACRRRMFLSTGSSGSRTEAARRARTGGRGRRARVQERLHQDRVRPAQRSRARAGDPGEVADDVAVRVDANEAWSVFEAVDALQRYEDVGVEFVEQPIDMHNIAGLADLRAKCRVRIGANQSAWLPTQVPDVIAQRAADVIVTDPHQLGGLVPFHNAATMCQTAASRFASTPSRDLGITTIASSHVLGDAALATARPPAVPDLPRPRPAANKVEFVDGAIAVPTGPGWASSSTARRWSSTRASTSSTASSRATWSHRSRLCRPTCTVPDR